MQPSALNLSWPNIVGYARVSSREQAEEGWSLEGQSGAIRAFAAERHLHVQGIYDDPGKSGASLAGRHGLAALLEAISTGGIGAVVVCRLDRLSRKTHHTDQLTRSILGTGSCLITLEPPTVQRPGGEEGTSLQQGLAAILAQDERARIIARVVPGVTQAMQRGIRGGRTPLGYQRLPDGRFATSEPWASRMVQVFSWAAEGRNLGRIGRDLQAAGWIRDDGTQVTWDQLTTSLANRFYLGELRWTVPPRLREVHGEVLVQERHHPALIDSLTFQQVRLHAERRTRKRADEREAAATTHGGIDAPARVRHVPAGHAPLGRSLETDATALVASIRRRQHPVHGVLGPEILTCGCGAAMYASLMTCGSRRHRYRRAVYQCHRRKKFGTSACPHGPVQVSGIDVVVVKRLRSLIVTLSTCGTGRLGSPSDGTLLTGLREKRDRLVAALALSPQEADVRARLVGILAQIASAESGTDGAMPPVSPVTSWWGLMQGFDAGWHALTPAQRRHVVTHAYARAVISDGRLVSLDERLHGGASHDLG